MVRLNSALLYAIPVLGGEIFLSHKRLHSYRSITATEFETSFGKRRKEQRIKEATVQKTREVHLQ